MLYPVSGGRAWIDFLSGTVYFNRSGSAGNSVESCMDDRGCSQCTDGSSESRVVALHVRRHCPGDPEVSWIADVMQKCKWRLKDGVEENPEGIFCLQSK